jgi:hypothetical protein
MLNEKGSLKEIPAMKLLLTIFEQNLTGILYIKREDILKVLYFNRGKVIWAISNSDVDKLENILLDRGLVDPVSIKKIKTQARISDSFGKLLVEQGLITLEELIESTKEQLRRIIISVLKWKVGGFQFIKDPPPERLLSLDLEVTPFIVGFILEEVELSEIWKEIGSHQVEFIRTPDEQKLAKYHLSDKQIELLNSFDGEKKLDTILSRYTSGHRESLLKIIYFFLMAELLIKKAFELSDLSFLEMPKGLDTFEPDTRAEKPEILDKPGKPDEPERPEEPEKPDEPEEPEEPGEPVEVIPVNSVSPDSFVSFDSPDSFDSFDSPNSPNSPVSPDSSDSSDSPDSPVSDDISEIMAEPAAPFEPFEEESDGNLSPPNENMVEDDYPNDSYAAATDVEMGTKENEVQENRRQELNPIPVRDEEKLMFPLSPLKDFSGEKKTITLFNVILIMIFLIFVIGGLIFLLLPLLENTGNVKNVVKEADKKGGKNIVALEQKTPPALGVDTAKPAETTAGTSTEKKASTISKPQELNVTDKDQKSAGRNTPPALLPGKSAKAYFLEGSLITAGDVWKKEMIKTGVKYGVLLEMDCLKESVIHAYDQIENKEAFFILNRNIGRKTCFLVIWGKFYSEKEATESLKSIPAYFWQQKDPPGVIELSPYL